MPKGIAIPVKANRQGRVRTLQGTPYLDQVIRSGLTPNISRNPFQAGDGEEVGISERIIFMINEAEAQAFIRNQIVRLFKRLREMELAKLAPGKEGIVFQKDGEELVVQVNYVDLEAERAARVEINVRDALRGQSRSGLV